MSITKLIANILEFKPNKLVVSHFYGKSPQPLMTAFDHEVNQPVILRNTYEVLFTSNLEMFKKAAYFIPSQNHWAKRWEKRWQKCWQKRWQKCWQKRWQKRWRSKWGYPLGKSFL